MQILLYTGHLKGKGIVISFTEMTWIKVGDLLTGKFSITEDRPTCEPA